jgi:very-short-patch-repair endonuclease
MLSRPQREISFEKSFASSPYSYLWSKKNKLRADQVSKGSDKIYFFECDICKHTYESRVKKVAEGQICSFCTKRRLCGNIDCQMCTDRSFASTPFVHLWSEINGIDPHLIFKYSNQNHFFECDVCNHIYVTQVSKITGGQSCLFCIGRQLCVDYGCEMCFQRSFASCPQSQYWSPKNIVDPRMVFKYTSDKYMFDCPVCKHTFDTPLCYMTGHGSFCTFCTNKRLCDDLDCEICDRKSCTSHEKMAECWSPKNVLPARMVFSGSSTKYIFDCNDCPHSFLLCPAKIRGGGWCQFCTVNKLCEDLMCKICEEKSFASHPKSAYWSKKNKVSPRQVTKRSPKKYMFDCPACGDEYISGLNNVTAGKWCTCTRHKTQSKMYKFLTSHFDFLIEKEKKFEWCKNQTYLPFDFFIEELNLIIELDGGQHFKQVSCWKSPKLLQKVDVYKMKLANQHNFSVIRIYQEDVWADKHNWDKNLLKAIKKYNNSINILIGDIYKLHPAYRPTYSLSKKAKL